MTLKTIVLTCFAMTAFAANSVFCRFALEIGSMDAGRFTLIRLGSGAVFLTLLAGRKAFCRPRNKAAWAMPLMLALYALFFSLAYVDLGTATGALILFGVVQATMLIAGFLDGERPGGVRTLGMATALLGLVYLLFPGLSSPSPLGAFFMVLAGIFWGIYCLLGKQVSNPVDTTAFNFIWAVFLFLGPTLFLSDFSPFSPGSLPWEPGLSGTGFWAAVLSGSLASGAGYVSWYAAIKGLTATQAASVQLTVPVIASCGGVFFLSESVTLRLFIASVVILSGVGLALLPTKKRKIFNSKT